MPVHQFDNDLVLLAEPMPWMESVSWSILVPYGPVLDPPELAGLAALTCEMSLRGAGSLDSRAFLQSLENLGCEISDAVSHLHTGYGASLLSENLLPSLRILADLVRRPHLPEDQLEAAKQVVRQDIFSLEDEPTRRLMQELYRNFLPDPWGRPAAGTLESIERIRIDDVRRQHARYIQPQNAILSVAGKFDWEILLDEVGGLFGDWKAQAYTLPVEKCIGTRQIHIASESAQTHLAVAYPSEPLRSPDYLPAWSSVGALSGGMSSRLFHEMREKRGLCYSVYASYFTLLDQAGVACYCGTSPDRARESLDVLIAELEKLRFGVEQNELDQLKIRVKSSLLMQQESTGSRSGTMTRDWYHLGRIRSLREIESNINTLTRKRINDYLASHPPGPFHIVTLGPDPVVS